MTLVTFGKTAIGGSVDTQGQDLKEAVVFTCPYTGILREVCWYLDGQGAGAGAQAIRGAVYADGAGNPGALLGAGPTPLSVPEGDPGAWYHFAGLTIPVVSGTPYWLSLLGDSPNDGSRLFYDTVATRGRFNTNTGGYAAGFTDPFGGASSLNFEYSAYATVEITADVLLPHSVSPALRG